VSVGYRASLLPTVFEKLAQRAGFAQRRRIRLAVELSWVERGRFFHCWRVGELPELHGEVKR
jgi:hypothetical protein